MRDLKRTGLVVLVAVCSILTSQGCGTPENTSSELNLDAASADYATFSIYHVDLKKENHITAFIMADIDGDGVQEYVQIDSDKMLGRDAERGIMNVHFEIEIPQGYSMNSEAAEAGVAKDLLNNDGVDELYFVIGANDNSGWRIVGVDPVTQKFFLNEALPIFESTRKEPWWDGTYSVDGYLDDADGKGQPGLVLGRRVRYDAFPRGIVVVSPTDGHIIWDYRCGGNASGYSIRVTDLEGDGSQEIFFYTTSPQNLGGRLVNGTSDDLAYFFVLSNTGQELYRQSMSKGFGMGFIEAADLNGDGVQELITFSDNRGAGHNNNLRIMDWKTKKVLAQKITPYSFVGLAIVDGPEPGKHWLITGTNKGTINRFLFDGKTMVSDGSLFYGVGDLKECIVLGAVELLPSPGKEIIVDVDGGKYTLILDKYLNTLAFYEDPKSVPREQIAVWNSESSNPYLICGGGRSQHILEFTNQSPTLMAKYSRYGVLLLLAGALFSTFLLGKMRGKKEQMTDAATADLPDTLFTNDRAALFRLWQELDDVKHESLMEASKGLRRLVWLLDAYASDLGGTVQLEDRIRKLRYDFLESVYPRLQDILHLAGKENFEPETIQGTSDALASLAFRLEELLQHEELTRDKVMQSREIMNSDLQVVESGFLHLWSSLRTYFTTDPVRMLEAMLVVREVEFQRAGIKTEILGETDPKLVSCIIDSGDIRYVLDNLVDNAVRAMEDSEQRRLQVQIVRDNGELALHVSDTGCGIDSLDYGKIFKGRFSSRAGGGMGLARSSDIMKKWHGEISLVDSTVGQGTTFVVKLRAAQKPEDPKSMEARS